MNRIFDFLVLPLLAIAVLVGIFLLSVQSHESFTITPECDVYASTYFNEYAVDFSAVRTVTRWNHTAPNMTGADITARVLIDGRIKQFKETYAREEADELMAHFAACRLKQQAKLLK